MSNVVNFYDQHSVEQQQNYTDSRKAKNSFALPYSKERLQLARVSLPLIKQIKRKVHVNIWFKISMRRAKYWLKYRYSTYTNLALNSKFITFLTHLLHLFTI